MLHGRNSPIVAVGTHFSRKANLVFIAEDDAAEAVPHGG